MVNHSSGQWVMANGSTGDKEKSGQPKRKGSQAHSRMLVHSRFGARLYVDEASNLAVGEIRRVGDVTVQRTEYGMICTLSHNRDCMCTRSGFCPRLLSLFQAE